MVTLTFEQRSGSSIRLTVCSVGSFLQIVEFFGIPYTVILDVLVAAGAQCEYGRCLWDS